jgi:Mg-chelatase subunit ChlD
MKQNSSRIVIVLDRSGSMQVVRQATIDGFNEFIHGQRAVAGDCRVRLVQFDHEIETLWDRPLNQVPHMTSETYVPRGNTALYDAMGQAITSEGIRLARMPERDRPAHVIVMVLTDGMENASREYNQSQIADMIRHQREQYSWQFIFLGANQDAVMTAREFSIPMQAAMTYDAGKMGTRNAFRSTTAFSNAVRQGNMNVAFSSVDRANAMEKDDDKTGTTGIAPDGTR